MNSGKEMCLGKVGRMGDKRNAERILMRKDEGMI
jgi:hypothetical protein